MNKKANILSIETSARVCSAALHSSGNLLGYTEIFIDKSHSRVLLDLILSLLKETGLTLADMDAFAVSKGPGSYTGLRIGVSTAKGLCFSMEKPLIGINTLESMAWGLNKSNYENALLCPMIDARRMEVYCAVFDSENKIIEDTQAKIIEENSFENLLSEKTVIFFGDGSGKCKKMLEGNRNAVFLNDIHPSAKHIGALASVQYEKNAFEDLAYFEPFYLKDFVSK